MSGAAVRMDLEETAGMEPVVSEGRQLDWKLGVRRENYWLSEVVWEVQGWR